MSYIDRPLTVRCAFDRYNKKISFSSARNCSFPLLHHKIEQCFSLYGSSFSISYKDDDGEVCEVSSDFDLSEAIQYFQADVDDPPISSGSSIHSGRSYGTRKITLRVHVTVDYDGRLSDTASLASIEDYPKPYSREDDDFSLSLGPRSDVDFDDDSITISSKDTGSRFVTSTSRLLPNVPGTASSLSKSNSTLKEQWLADNQPSSSLDSSHLSPFRQASPLPREPSPQRSGHELTEHDLSSVYTNHRDSEDRGVAWLRDQEKRAIRSKLGALPDPSEPGRDSLVLEEAENPLEGDLALEMNPRGSYYYSYTTSSHAADDEPLLVDPKRPTSMQLLWLAEQRVDNKPSNVSPVQTTKAMSSRHDNEIPREFLELVPPSAPPPHELSPCAECGVVLSFMRYTCASCQEDIHLIKGKFKALPSRYIHAYPPTSSTSSNPTPSSSSSPQTVVEGFDGMSTFGSHFQLQSPIHDENDSSEVAYRLCANCLPSVGVAHAVNAVNASLDSNDSPISTTSPSGSEWLRSAPTRKGKRRHAFREQIWGHMGWEDVKYAESEVSKCSTCDAVTSSKRYKCAFCDHFSLCRACYGHVHELHPLHPFLLVPDNVERSSSDPESLSQTSMSPEDLLQDEPTLIHPGVKCAHCMLDIVGARFHCAICPEMDICSNCESAGLPGNLHSDEGGHNSSHILIKIPYPLENTEVQTASRRAVNLWTGRDAASVAFGGERSRSPSAYARTVVGGKSSLEEQEADHHILCNYCHKPIVGIRYQCGNCPSNPRPYSLCSECECRSYQVHDPMHVFFKLPRPVDRLLQSTRPTIPILYEKPAGPAEGQDMEDDPKAYLTSLVHNSAVCDRCMVPIRGVWFRCGNCPLDLCDNCEENDTHDDCHVFLVFKAPVQIEAIGQFVNMEDPQNSPPILPQKLYLHRTTR